MQNMYTLLNDLVIYYCITKETITEDVWTTCHEMVKWTAIL